MLEGKDMGMKKFGSKISWTDWTLTLDMGIILAFTVERQDTSLSHECLFKIVFLLFL